MNTISKLSMGVIAAGLAAGVAYGQGGRGGGGGWTTSRGDAQRTAWVRNDAYISVEEMQKPGFGLQWSTKAGHTPREVLSEGVSNNTAQLDPHPGNVAGSGNNLYGYEIDTGAVTWTKHFDAPAGAAATAACPGGMTGGVTRETSLTEGVIGATPGRAGAARGFTGGVGAPGEGVPASLMVGRGRGGRGASGRGGFGGPGAPAFGAGAGGRGASGRGPGGGGGGGGLRGAPAIAYIVASDGMLHMVGQSQGKELKKPVQFLPANANVGNLIATEGMVYATTINNCGGVPDGVWAVELDNGAVTSWKSGANIAGPVAFSAGGTLYVALGAGPAGAKYADSVVALDPKTLAVKDWFTMPGATFSTNPVVFASGGKEMVAAATKDGRVFVLDGSSLGGSDHKTAVATSAATTTVKTWAPSSLATWEDASQGRWIALPASGASTGIVAFRLNGSSLTRAWAASVASPSAPIVVNGVVFALNTGSAAAPATLYAIDGSNGKELWNSGKTMKAASHTGLWSISGQVYVATNDAMLYAFGTSQGR
ncbi:MAG TPA: hypothetical protein VHA14_03095 [Bryobacteraceae bacterium]|nr:hypothetical protein [Bryobacteraceae bacterium]